MDRQRYLIDTLNQWAYEYYVLDAPTHSDREYDKRGASSPIPPREGWAGSP